MDLSNIGHFIEISQVGQMDGNPVWIHSDPVSTRQNAHTMKEVHLCLYFKFQCVNQIHVMEWRIMKLALIFSSIIDIKSQRTSLRLV